MIPSLRKTLSGGPPPYPLRPKGWGVNVKDGHYYASIFQFANQFHYSTGGFQASAGTHTDNAFLWPSNMSATWVARIGLSFNKGAETDYFPPGDYIVRAPVGFIATVDAGSDGSVWTNLVQGTAGSPNATFTIPAFPARTRVTQGLYVTLANNTGAVVAAFSREPFAGLVSDLANHDAGMPWCQAFINSLRGASMIRVNDVRGFNNNGASHAFDGSHLPTESNMNWGQGPSFMLPISAAVKLCKRVNSILWMCFPCGNEGFVYSANATTSIFSVFTGGGSAPSIPTNHGYAEDQPVILWGFAGASPTGTTKSTVYYVKLVAGQPTQFQLKATAGGTVITISTSQISAYGFQVNSVKDPLTYYTSMVQQAKTQWTGIRILVEIENENWNSAYQRGYVGQVASVQSGRTLDGSQDDGAAGNLWLCSKAWKAVETLLSRSQCVRSHIAQNQTGGGGNFVGGLNLLDPGVIQAGAAYKTLLDNVCTAAYTGVQNYPPGLASRGAMTWTDQQWYDEHIATNTGLATATAQTVSAHRAIAPGIPVVLYECAYLAEYNRASDTTPQVNIRDVYRGMLRYQQSALHATAGRDYLSRVLDANGISSGCFWNEWQFYSGSLGLGTPGGGSGDFGTNAGTIANNDKPDTPYSSVIKGWRGV